MATNVFVPCSIVRVRVFKMRSNVWPQETLFAEGFLLAERLFCAAFLRYQLLTPNS